jgi:hypothetical protein
MRGVLTCNTPDTSGKHTAAVLRRLLVAFNTSSGLPVTYVPLRDAAGRAKSGMADANTNIAEAGTISMEFTSIGRLLGKTQPAGLAHQLLRTRS